MQSEDTREVSARITDLEEQLEAAVGYIRDHESRLKQTENAVQTIWKSAAWKFVLAAREKMQRFKGGR